MSGWVEVNDASPTRSDANLGGATGSFNYQGPVVGGLPSVTGTKDFWASRDAFWQNTAGAALAPQTPPLLIAAGVALVVWLAMRGGR